MLNSIIKNLTKFNSIGAAKDYTYRTIKPTVVVHGDDGLYWICNGREFTILKKAGYEKVEL